MATLTVADDRLQQVDEFAKKEERSREEIVDEAIYLYLREKTLNEIRDDVKRMGITEEDIFNEIKLYREEKRQQ
jgi:metal-responsive CopG/Arc/MetJ family transcriptional regulator